MSETLKYVPELNYYFYQYWTTYGEIGVDIIKVPIINSDDTSLFTDGSFIELLFNNNYSESDYNYYFKTTELSNFSISIVERIKFISSTAPTCYISTTDDDDDAEDIFSTIPSGSSATITKIRTDNTTMLDLLLNYRNDVLVDLTTVDYDDLDSKLAKLIYLYLDLMINNNYSELNTDSLLSDSDSLLENLFELYVINEAHKSIKNWKVMIDSEEVELKIKRSQITLDDDDISAEYVKISDQPYNINEYLWIFKNGSLLNSNLYTIATDSTSFTIDWSTTTLTLTTGDQLTTDYYTEATVSSVDSDEFYEKETDE